MTVAALRLAIQHLHQTPHDSKVYEEVRQAAAACSTEEQAQVLGEVTEGTYNFAIALTVLPARVLMTMNDSFYKHCLSAPLYEKCLAENKKLTGEWSARFAYCGYETPTKRLFVAEEKTETTFTPPEKEENPDYHEWELFERELKAFSLLTPDAQEKVKNYIEDTEVQVVSELVKSQMEWVTDQPLWLMKLILEKAQDQYGDSHDRMASTPKYRSECWIGKINEKEAGDESTLKKEVMAALPPNRSKMHYRVRLLKNKIKCVIESSVGLDCNTIVESAAPEVLAHFLVDATDGQNNLAWLFEKLPLIQVNTFLKKAEPHLKKDRELAERLSRTVMGSGWREAIKAAAITACLPGEKNAGKKKLSSGSNANKIKYLTSGQFWVGLLLALGLVLMCMPFAAPVVFPVLGLTAFVSTAAGTVALEASIAAVCGFGIFQLLWKFGDRIDLAQNLQKLGQWVEKWIKRLVYAATAGVSYITNGVLGVIQLIGGGLAYLWWKISTDAPKYFAWNMGGFFFLSGAAVVAASVVGILAITVPLGLSALVMTGVGLVLEALGWILAWLPLKGVGSNPEDSFFKNVKNWVCYLMAFPFFQLQKLGKFIAEIAFTVFMSVYADFGAFGFAILNFRKAMERDEIGKVKNTPICVYPLPYLKEEKLSKHVWDSLAMLDHSSCEHKAVPLVVLPKAAQERSQDSDWVSEVIPALVQTGFRLAFGAGG